MVPPPPSAAVAVRVATVAVRVAAVAVSVAAVALGASPVSTSVAVPTAGAPKSPPVLAPGSNNRRIDDCRVCHLNEVYQNRRFPRLLVVYLQVRPLLANVGRWQGTVGFSTGVRTLILGRSSVPVLLYYFELASEGRQMCKKIICTVHQIQKY